jgi:hypothetical protein
MGTSAAAAKPDPVFSAEGKNSKLVEGTSLPASSMVSASSKSKRGSLVDPDAQILRDKAALAPAVMELPSHRSSSGGRGSGGGSSTNGSGVVSSVDYAQAKEAKAADVEQILSAKFRRDEAEAKRADHQRKMGFELAFKETQTKVRHHRTRQPHETIAQRK